MNENKEFNPIDEEEEELSLENEANGNDPEEAEYDEDFEEEELVNNPFPKLVTAADGVIGLIFWFAPSLPEIVTLFCAAFCIIDRVVEIFHGEKPFFYDLGVAALIALVYSFVTEASPLYMVAVALCVVCILRSVWKFFKHLGDPQ